MLDGLAQCVASGSGTLDRVAGAVSVGSRSRWESRQVLERGGFEGLVAEEPGIVELAQRGVEGPHPRLVGQGCLEIGAGQADIVAGAAAAAGAWTAAVFRLDLQGIARIAIFSRTAAGSR